MKKQLILTIVLAIGIQLSFAQPGDPGGDPDVPISGIEYLLGLGALFGFRKIMKSFSKKS